MRNIKLIIEYDGTNYRGWQSQKNVSSIQETIQKAIEKITGSKPNLNGSGRTDAGVHAFGQVANFFTESKIPADRFTFALNAVLPKDIVIKASSEAEMDFHARYSAVGKRYSYLMLNSKQPTALYRNLAYHISYCDKLNIDQMRIASKYFVGTHDFSGFMATGSSVKDTIRTIYDIKITQNEDIIKLTYHGNGFLYNMVRIISGTLLYAGIGKIDSNELSDIIDSKDRTKAGLTLPAHGLYLEKVLY
ncbi:MAG: tRNA pseudouridine(38-40) synthase TruA [Clostridiales bacterium GWB2_37_7]|nr:MAG: tRNA pseudouridine(38-40) synthase TruA [Clostridiales bacterium GWB2_37_7]